MSKFLFGKANYESVAGARKLIIWLVVIVAVITVIILLTKTNLIGLVKSKGKNTAFSFSDITEDLETINFEQRIADALKDDNFRLAIRWHYLKILFLLDKNKHINFAPYKTNFDYAYEIKNSTIKSKFNSASKIYEFVWYGKFDLDKNKYETSKKEFKDFEAIIHV